MSRIAIPTAAVLAIFAGAASGQTPAAPSSKNEVIRAIIDRFESTYVFPDVARRVRLQMEQRIREDSYRDVGDGAPFAEALTRELRAITADQHVTVKYSERPLPPMNAMAEVPTPKAREESRRRSAMSNHGFLKVERLPGNIGLLDLDFFADPELAGETATAAMSFLADTDALIVDLRYNGGGNSRMVALVASYLFDEQQHLNDIVVPRDNLVKQSWTLPYVAGRKFGAAKMVYILTSARTFSGAEELAYNLQALGRATIVGERTRGGANPSRRFRISEHYGVILPTAQAVNPHTKSSWEGVGVLPEIEVPATEALRTAELRILDALIRDGDASLKEERLRRKSSLEKRADEN